MRDFFLKEVSCFPCMFSLVENKHNVHVQQHPSQEKHRLTDKLYQKKMKVSGLDMNVQAIVHSSIIIKRKRNLQLHQVV